ncbi:hypothetical protein F4821DRAFT_131648 [Hypoxylon rubiginosum]|uniref:Uncharacterized protein n=1 Tax=Hypoxylon rubiginosum TaxID=110542 RepID=A0ACC0D0L7_9PEZI|nr:hypothetical protein F4821DRAFT_131648 [Hypoxylon rubiginosum]
MLLFLEAALVTIALLAAPSRAAPQDDWIFPVNPDQTSDLVTGTSYTIKWDSNLKHWFAEYCDACDTQNLDLWVLGGNNFHKLSSGINVESTLSYTWTPDIPSSELNVDLWVFRFLASGVEFEGTQTQSIASPIFFLREGDGDSETTTSQSTPKSSTATSTSSSSSSTSATFDPINTASETDAALSPHGTASPNSKDASSNSGLSKAAMIGIGVGIAVGAALGCLMCFFCYQRGKHRRTNLAPTVSPLIPLKRGPSSRDGGSPIAAQGYSAGPRAETAESYSGMTGLGVLSNNAPVGVAAAVYSPSVATGYGFAPAQDAARLGTAHSQASIIGVAASLQNEAAAAAMPGTWIYDRRTAMSKELQGDQVVAELEYMPLAELSASPVAAELPIHNRDR